MSVRRYILIILVGLVLISTAYIYIAKPTVELMTLSVNIKPQKDSYKIGDNITVYITARNLSFKTYSKTFSTTDTGPWITVVGSSNYDFPLAGMAFTDFVILPFHTKKSIPTFRLDKINGDTTGKTLGVKPGMNTVSVSWAGETKEVELYVDPASF